MSNDLQKALAKFIESCRGEFRDGKAEAGLGASVRLMLSNDQLLLRLVDRIEESKEFLDLVVATEKEYSGPLSGRNPSRWISHVQTFLRLSGFYLDSFEELQWSQENMVDKYEKAFRPNSDTLTHLIPLEFFSFYGDCLDWRSFQIRRFSCEEIDSLLMNPAKKVFYKEAYVNSEKLSQWWLLSVQEIKPRKDLGKIMIEGYPVPPRVSYSQHPAAVESALKLLALYDWRPTGSRFVRAGLLHHPWRRDTLVDQDADAGPIRPEMPIYITCSDSLVEWPRAAPDLAVLGTEPVIEADTGQQIGEAPLSGACFDAEETADFQTHLSYCAEALAKLTPYLDQWRFVEVALGFLLKGFLSENVEQLLWNITAIEAVLGERMEIGVTKRLRNRVTRVLGSTVEQRKEIGKRFDDLYSIRSDLVHGNAALPAKSVSFGHLKQAREFARAVVLWMLGYLNHVIDRLPEGTGAFPSRDTLLSLIDADTDSRAHIGFLAQAVPAGFPDVADWLKRK